MALSEAIKQLSWTIQVVKNLQFSIDLPITIYEDSKGARDIASNNVHHNRTKHIDIKHHFVREKVHDGTVHLQEITSAENVADILTKPLPLPAHSRHTCGLGLYGASDKGEC